jgi:hypothetical protein
MYAVRRLRTLRAREVRGCTFDADASRASSLYDAVSGGSPVAPDGEVARWESAAPGAHHATQATASLRPLYRRRGLNGFPCLESTGSSTCNLQTASYYPSSGSAAFTAITVSEPDVSIAFGVAWEYGQNASARRVTFAPRYLSGYSAIDVFGAYIGRSTTTEDRTPSVCAVRFPSPARPVDSITRWYGKQATYNHQLNSSVTLNVGTGIPLRLMSENTGTWRIKYLAQVAFFDRELSIPAIMRLEQAAMRKWRIASARS